MRILFSFVGGAGHLEPLLPLARAAAAAGHEVAFACAPAMVAAVRAAGLAALPIGREAGGPPPRLPLRAVDRARELRELRERFVERAAAYRLPRIAAACESWRPAVLVGDETDFAAALAAERAGLPFATVAITATGGFVRPEAVAGALDALRAAHGLPPDPRLEAPGRQLLLSPFPAALRDPDVPTPPDLLRYRAWTRERPASAASPWPARRACGPAIYLTLGTVFNTESGDLLSRMLAGLRDLAGRLLVTTGPAIDPAELGPQPPHVRVARFVPQREILPGCDLVASHAGSGSLLGALTWGLPSLLVPLGADQPWNAARCAALGVAEVLQPLEATPPRVREAAGRVLEDPAYRSCAAALGEEIAALPEPSRAVRALEALAAPGA